MPIVPEKLRAGDTVRVVAPADNMVRFPPEQVALATERLVGLGLHVTLGARVTEDDGRGSSPVAARVSDLHEAFRDPAVRGVFSVIGGHNSNQLLRHVDWELLAANPKVFCGYSDMTALQNAALARSGLVTYSGPHFTTFSMRKGLEYTLEHLRRCLFEEGPFEVRPSGTWSDDAWYADQEHRTFRENPGYAVLQEGEAEGRVVGGNLCTLLLLVAGGYMPSLDGAVLFLEDVVIDGAGTLAWFDRHLQSVLHHPSATGLRGLVLGRFPVAAEVTRARLAACVASKDELRGLPVLADADFGHTTPHFTFPVGGTARLVARRHAPSLTLLEH